MNKTKIILLSIGGFLVFAALVLLAYWYGEKKGYDLAWFEIEDEEEEAIDPDVYNCRIEIGMGSRGAEVLAFQRYYNDNRAGFTSTIAEDGVFGPETRIAADTLGLPNKFALTKASKHC